MLGARSGAICRKAWLDGAPEEGEEHQDVTHHAQKLNEGRLGRHSQKSVP